MAFDWFPLWLSLRVATLTTAIALPAGLWLAWLLARATGKTKTVLNILLVLPMVMPTTVIAWFLLKSAGKVIAFTWYAAVAASLVSALPLLARRAARALETVPPRYADAARTLGASEWRTFWKVSLPLAWHAVLAATVAAFARAMGEFGITLILAGNIPGQTQTMPVALYDAILVGRQDTAILVAAILTASSLLAAFAIVTLERPR